MKCIVCNNGKLVWGPLTTPDLGNVVCSICGQMYVLTPKSNMSRTDELYAMAFSNMLSEETTFKHTINTGVSTCALCGKYIRACSQVELAVQQNKHIIDFHKVSGMTQDIICKMFRGVHTE